MPFGKSAVSFQHGLEKLLLLKDFVLTINKILNNPSKIMNKGYGAGKADNQEEVDRATTGRNRRIQNGTFL